MTQKHFIMAADILRRLRSTTPEPIFQLIYDRFVELCKQGRKSGFNEHKFHEHVYKETKGLLAPEEVLEDERRNTFYWLDRLQNHMVALDDRP